MLSSFPLRSMHIFDGSGSPVVDVEALEGYCRQLLGDAEVLSHGDLLEYVLRKIDGLDPDNIKSRLAKEIASARVTDPFRRNEGGAQQRVFVDYERRMLERDPPRPTGVLYDGLDLCLAYGTLLAETGIDANDLVVVITNQLFGTLEGAESRYHARVIVFGGPCIVSTTGLVEAPARPREHYLQRQLGLDRIVGREDEQERWLRTDDPRTTEVLKGYLAQAIFFHLTGDPFCEEKGCRLFNAHWQEDLLFSQLESGRDFCERHQEIARSFTGARDG